MRESFQETNCVLPEPFCLFRITRPHAVYSQSFLTKVLSFDQRQSRVFREVLRARKWINNLIGTVIQCLLLNGLLKGEGNKLD